MEHSIFKFIWRHSKRDQLVLLAITVLSYPFTYIYLDVPKRIINHLQAVIDHNSTSELSSFPVTSVLGIEFSAVALLFSLCVLFLVLVLINQGFKYVVNVMSGILGERMLRRLRYELFTRILRFPLPHFKRVSQGELISMITQEVEPLGGFIGDAIKVPAFQGGLLLVPFIFIIVQNPLLGIAAIALYPLQAWFIPKLQRRVNMLAKERVRTVRQLSERIGESVSSVQEIHANDTSAFERTDIATRLGRIFKIRFQIFRLKFLIKFLNNTLDKLTPFFFYSLGGYLAITGRLDLGALVAVINAHKDIAGPWKELLRYYQTKEDARIKYEQVVEQFEPAGMMGEEHLDADPDAAQVLAGDLAASNVSLSEDVLGIALNNVTFETPLNSHTALIGAGSSGRDALGVVLARLVPPTSGSIRVGDLRFEELPEAVTGRQMAYVGQSVQLFSGTVRDNLFYGLKHRPGGPRAEDADPEWNNDVHEARLSGNIELDPLAEWIDYESAGATDLEDLIRVTVETLARLDMDEDIYQFGLRGVIDPDERPEVAEQILAVRQEVRKQLSDPQIAALVEQFDNRLYNSNATLAENLLFGLPKGDAFDLDRLAENAYVLHVLDANDLTEDFLETGRQIAETMVELFADVAPGHPFFDQFSFISADDLPDYQAIVARVSKGGLDELDMSERTRLLSLPFKMIPARHRLGLIDERLQARIVEARAYFAENLPDELKDAIEFFEVSRYVGAANIQDNILFGKMAYGQAQSASRIGKLIAESLDRLGLRNTVMEIGLDFHVGVGGSRLSAAQRQKLGIARALLRRPKLLILNGATTVLDGGTQPRIIENILDMRAGQGVIWALQEPRFAHYFDYVVLMRDGSAVAKGRYEELNRQDSPLAELVAAQ